MLKSILSTAANYKKSYSSTNDKKKSSISMGKKIEIWNNLWGSTVTKK